MAPLAAPWRAIARRRGESVVGLRPGGEKREGVIGGGRKPTLFATRAPVANEYTKRKDHAWKKSPDRTHGNPPTFIVTA